MRDKREDFGYEALLHTCFLKQRLEGPGRGGGRGRGKRGKSYQLRVEFSEAWLAGVVEDENGVDHL